MPYRVATDPRFRRRFKKKPPERQAALERCIELLADDPFANRGSLQTKVLQVTGERIYYARIDRSHRVTFHIQGDVIVLRNHCHKEDVLRSP